MERRLFPRAFPLLDAEKARGRLVEHPDHPSRSMAASRRCDRVEKPVENTMSCRASGPPPAMDDLFYVNRRDRAAEEGASLEPEGPEGPGRGRSRYPPAP